MSRPKLVPVYRRWGGDAKAMAYRLWRVRKALKMNRGQIATVYGVTPTTYGKWERAISCPNRSAQAILRELEAGGEPVALRSFLADREMEVARKRVRIAQKYVHRD